MAKKQTKIRQRRSTGSEAVVKSKILLIRGHKVILGTHVAELYRVSAKAFNQAVRRNLHRFPEDFMFQLTNKEAAVLRSQFVTLDIGRGQFSKYAPMAFTEHGVAMLSGVLTSKRAVQMHILIVRAFVKLREQLALHKELALRMDKVEMIQEDHASGIIILAEQIQELKQPKRLPSKTRIGFHPSGQEDMTAEASVRKKSSNSAFKVTICDLKE